MAGLFPQAYMQKCQKISQKIEYVHTRLTVNAMNAGTFAPGSKSSTYGIFRSWERKCGGTFALNEKHLAYSLRIIYVQNCDKER